MASVTLLPARGTQSSTEMWLTESWGTGEAGDIRGQGPGFLQHGQQLAGIASSPNNPLPHPAIPLHHPALIPHSR